MRLGPPDAIRKLLNELEANRKSRKSAWATLQRLRKFLEATGARISIPEERNFETEGEAIESGIKRTIAGRDAVMRSLIRAVYRFRDAALVAAPGPLMFGSQAVVFDTSGRK